MKERIKRKLEKLGLVGFVTLGVTPYFIPFPLPKNYVSASNRDEVFKKYIIDKDKDGEADIAFSVLMGSRIPYSHTREATQEEKNFYATHKRN